RRNAGIGAGSTGRGCRFLRASPGRSGLNPGSVRPSQSLYRLKEHTTATEDTMRSSNPVFNRTDGFNGHPAAPVGFDDHPTHTELGRGTGRMTLETVIEKTAITSGLVAVTAGIAWFLIGDLSTQQSLGTAYMLSMVGAFGGFI